MAVASDDADIRMSAKDLRTIFERSQNNAQLIGLEHEKISFRLSDGGQVPYAGQTGEQGTIQQLLRRFADAQNMELGLVEGALLSVSGGGQSVTLEPGGQIELSGAPQRDLAGVQSELQSHLHALLPIARELGIGLSTLGFHPDRDPAATEFVPKPRYPFMRRYFSKSGTRGAHMMACTATVQVNLDYSDERTAMRKMRAAQLASPFVTAIFANSPFEMGRHTGWVSRRYMTWLDVDARRSGLIPSLYRDDATYDSYIEWALQAPMFGIHRDGVFFPAPALTFGAYLRDGFDGFHATRGDWFDHLSTVFPEVRIKKTIELRGADAGTPEHCVALAGLWRGLLDEPSSLIRVLEYLEAPTNTRALSAAIAHTGLRTPLADYFSGGCAATRCGAQALDVAWELTEIAQRGLYSLSDPLAPTALQPVFEALSDGLCPADILPTRASALSLLTQTQLV